jgi:CTP:molybdopterin cytidylyltransferase MocA
MIFAVVPAAGHSTRMGRPKLALPLGGRVVIQLVVDALRSGGCDHVVAVIGPHVPELVAPAAAAGAHVRVLAEPTPDMRATVIAGLEWLEQQFHPGPQDAWFLVPGDHPTLDSGVVRQLIAEYESGGHTIIVPTAGNRRGHPSLIAWTHVANIRARPAGEGLNTYFRTRADQTRELPVAAPSILSDLDTPEDYERLRATFGA